MGGFGSKGTPIVNEEVAARGDSRDDVAERTSQAFVASFNPAALPAQPLASAGSSQSSQAPRHKPPASSLHVNSRLAAETLPSDWDRALGSADMGVALAEEEDMQAAIAASLRDEPLHLRSGGASGATDCHCSHATGVEERARPPVHLPGSALQDESGALALQGKRLSDPKDKLVIAQKMILPAGLAGNHAWVDNSDFHSPCVSKTADRKASAPRSASVGSRGASSRSGIVSLPRLGQTIPADQQAMVKDLHENIKDTVATRDEARAGQASGQSGRNASADVRRVMEDLNIDEPTVSRGPRGFSAERERYNEQFNERFHSCSEAPQRPPVAAPPDRRGPSL